MVDFNNEATISTPASDIMRVLILERQNNFIEAWESYKKTRLLNVKSNNNIVKARLISLFLQLYPLLKRRLSLDAKGGKGMSFSDLTLMVNSPKSDEEILQAFLTMSVVLDAVRLTRIDHKRDIDTSKVEEENKEWGL